MKKELLYPVSIYRYQRHCNHGTLWNYINHDGIEQPELVYVRKVNPEKGRRYITVNKQAGKKNQGCPEQALFGNVERKIIKHGKEIITKKVSGFFMPDEGRPGCGFGEINNNRDAILIRKTESEMMIMVFPENGNGGALALFTKWGTGAVRECIPSNNVYLNTETVTA